MASQAEKYRFKNTNLSDAEFNKRWLDIDLRLVKAEEQLANIDQATDQLIERGLEQINEQLSQSIDEVQTLVEGAQQAIEELQEQVEDILDGGNLPATNVILDEIDGLAAANAQDAFEEHQAAIEDLESEVNDANDAIALKAPILSPTFLGNPTVPNRSANNNSTLAANTAYVDAAVAALAAAGPTPGLKSALGVRARGASDMLRGEAGVALDFYSRTMAVNDYANTLSQVGRPGDLLTVARAGATGTYVDRDRRIKVAPANTLRYDHNPLTGEPLGILVEPARTNSWLQSEDLGTSHTNTSGSVTSNAIAAPDGNTTADLFTVGGSPGTIACTQSPAQTPGTAYTFSSFVKKSVGDWVSIRVSDGTTGRLAWFNLVTGVVGTVQPLAGGFTVFSARIEAYGNGWYRIFVTMNSSVGTTFQVSTIPCQTNGGSPATADAVYSWGRQYEAGTYATSYIATTTVSVARATDVITAAKTLFPFNALEGTLVLEARPSNASAFLTAVSAVVLALDDGTVASRTQLRTNPAGPTLEANIQANSVLSATIGLGSLSVGATLFRAAVGWRADDFSAGRDGAAPGVDTAGAVPTVTTLTIGSLAAGGAPWTGWIGSVMAIDRKMANAEIQALTL